jgi:hypothetical protein
MRVKFQKVTHAIAALTALYIKHGIRLRLDQDLNAPVPYAVRTIADNQEIVGRGKTESEALRDARFFLEMRRDNRIALRESEASRQQRS